jgi:hypothetical protein
MSKAIIQNSDYQSAEECRLAMDRYFNERNENFRVHPKRAGKRSGERSLLTHLSARRITANILDGKSEIAITGRRILQTQSSRQNRDLPDKVSR